MLRKYYNQNQRFWIHDQCSSLDNTQSIVLQEDEGRDRNS